MSNERHEPTRPRLKALRGALGALTISASGLIAAGLPAHADATAFSMSRAVNVAQWFTWPRYEANGRGIAWPPYKTSPAPPSDAELKALRTAGFDTIRLPVDPAPFVVFEGRRREDVYTMLFDALKRINAAGLKVIVDIHPNSRHAVWGQNAVAAGPEAPAFLAVAGVIAEIAGRLTAADRSSVALELLNEPRLKCKGEEQERWQRMASLLVQRARGANPLLALIVTGACISSVDGLLALDPSSFHDPNVFYTFHFYEPFSFSHQGAQFIPWPDKYLDGLPWPASARPFDAPLALLNKRIDALPNMDDTARNQARNGAYQNLKRFYTSQAGPETIRPRFAQLRSWAKRYGIPPSHLLNGEFGVIRKSEGTAGALCPDRLRWIRDVREASEASGFAWAYFNYDGPFALLVDEKERHFDQGVLSSLGLTSRCPVGAAAVKPGTPDFTTSSGGSDPVCCPTDAR